ncbi:MAG: HDIG domain-containing protein, partial [Clostridia bacterium]|nr:HDIG domain-containing protein [Clostridia bacterium]
ELGCDVNLAKPGGLLHDIGKAVDHEMEGTHIQIGTDLAKKYKESGKVINCIQAHHGDVEPTTIEAVLVQAADAISGARPGARRETTTNYVKRLEQLEGIGAAFKGVDKCFAIQAGREIRVIVKPEQIDDAQSVFLAKDIAKKIEEELEYPGQIKVNVIREFRSVEYAK